MLSRPWLGDLALAILVSIPIAAIATTAHAVHDVNPPAIATSAAAPSPVADRFSLFAPN